MVLDTGTASQAEIDRLFPSTNPAPVQRQAAAYTRVGIEALMARGKEHSVTWLSYPSRSPDGDTIDVFVWARVSDAAISMASLQRSRNKALADAKRWMKQHGASGKVDVSPWGLQRVRNVLISYSPSVRGEARRVRAAISDLTQ